LVPETQVLDFTPREAKKEITKDEVKGKLKLQGVGVLVKTGWMYISARPITIQHIRHLARSCRILCEMNVPLLAADTPFTLDVHYIILKHGIPLVTNINNTGQLKEGMIKLIAAPLLIRGSDGAPARVLAVVE